jgi:tetratricopeptide (TPR) repeat protein
VVVSNPSPWGYRIVAAAVFVVSLAVYTATLTTSVPFWDSGEFIATSYVLGIPHPPGTPLYVLIGRVFSLLPFGDVAWRVNWLSALSAALAVLFTFILTVRFLRYAQGENRTLGDEIIAWTGGACAAFFAAFSDTFWGSAIEAEVYALSSWLQVFILYLGLKWWEGLGRGEGDNRLLLAWYLCFLSVGIHLGTFLVMPALVLLVLMVNWRSLLSPRNLAWAAVLAICGLSVHLYLYLRAQANPPINEGDPQTWESLRAMLMREQYGSRPMFPRSTTWAFQFDMYFRYFFNQYVLTGRLGLLGAWIPTAIGIFGALVHAMRHRRTFWIQGLTFLITSLGLLLYLNFTDHEVRERDYFYTSSFHFFSIWIGMGMAFLLEWAREKVPVLRRTAVLIPAALACVGVSLLPMAYHWRAHDRSGFYVARDYAYNMLALLEDRAVLFTNGDNDTFPLWYLQEVEKVRKDVRVVNLSLLNTDWYIRQLRDEEPKVPMQVTDADLEMVRYYGAMRDPRTGQPTAVNDAMVQNILATNLSTRPVYLAVTVPNHHGLDDRLVLEGLVMRVSPEPVVAGATIGFTGKNWLDIGRTDENLYRKFQYRSLFDDNGNWLAVPYKDENTRRMSQNYGAAHLQLAYEYRRRGEYDKAIAELQRILRMFPDYPVAGLLGLFYLDSGDSTRAIAHFREQMQRRPNDTDLIYYYGVALGFLGQTDSAVAMLLRAGESDPNEVQAYKAAYGLLLQEGRQAEAGQVLQRLVERHPDDPEVRAYLEAMDSTRGSWLGDGAPPPPPGAGP